MNGGTCGEAGEAFLLLQEFPLLALENGVKRIAFPSVSTGIYHFPVELAAETAIGTAREFAAEYPGELEHDSVGSL